MFQNLHIELTSIFMKRRIKSQGDLDGACYLYSLINAVDCLRRETGDKKDISKLGWQRLISEVYGAQDFLKGSGTSRIDHSPELILQLTQHYLAFIDQSYTYNVERLSGIDNASDLSDCLTHRSVLLVDNGDHWFCLVDLDEAHAFAACSAAFHELGKDYRELLSPRLERLFNTSFSRAQLSFNNKIAYRVSIKN